MPYATLVAGISLIGYIALGALVYKKNQYGYAALLSLTLGPALILGILSVILIVLKSKKKLPHQIVEFNKNKGDEDEERNYHEA